MHYKICLSAAVAATALLSGCANTQTTCPLNNEEGYCASVEQVNDAARSGTGNKENVFGDGAYSEFKGTHPSGSSDSNGGGRSSQDSNRYHGGPSIDPGVRDPGPGAGLAGPIYTPAQPRRLWVAPWTDANGVVHSGEYLYFLRPGHWRYGPLRTPGAASGAMGPVAPSDLGFNPNKMFDKSDQQKAAAKSNDPAGIEQPRARFQPPTAGGRQ